MDIERGDAVALGDDEVYCRACAPGGAVAPSSAPVRSAGGRRHSPGSGTRRSSRESSRLPAERPEGSSATTILIVLGVLGLLGLLVASVYLMSDTPTVRSRKAPPHGTTEGDGAQATPEGGGEAGGGDVADTPPERTEPLSLREQGAADMVAGIEEKWKSGELSRYDARLELDKFFQRYPGTKAVEAAKKLIGTIPEPEPGTGMWYVISGFPSNDGDGIDIAYPPEEEIDLKKEYPLDGGAVATWRQFDVPQATFNLRETNKNTNIVYYAFAYLVSASDQEVEVYTNSDDGIKAWINGEVFVSQDVHRGVNTDPDTMARASLKKGHNPVLVKVMQGGGAAALRLYVKENAAEVFRTTRGPGSEPTDEVSPQPDAAPE